MNLNPFDDLSLVQGYEDWYANQGLHADRLEKVLLEWLIDHFQEPRSILDVGCGTGHFTRWFELLGLWAVGLDISPVMLREARRFGMRPAVRADASHLPFEDGALDLVAMITTVEFLRDPVQALQEAMRVAQKGLILGVINRKSYTGREYRRQGGPPWQSAHFFTPAELMQMLGTIKDAGTDLFWRTTLLRFFPWALPLPWGGFIGMGLRLQPNDESISLPPSESSP